MRKKIKSLNLLVPSSLRTYIIAALLVLLSSLSVTIWTWRNAKSNLNEDIHTSLQSGLTGARDIITGKIDAYTEVLNGGVSLFRAQDNVTADQWDKYVSNLHIQEKYPGLQSMTFSEYVAPMDVQKYTHDRQLDVRPGYSITPAGQRDAYFPARFIAPSSPETSPLIGYDAFSEPIRKKAMENARDSGMPSMTKRIVLLSDKNKNLEQPGFIIYLPVYAPTAPISSVGERRVAIEGFISSGVRSNILIEGLFGKSLTKDTALQVFDGTRLTSDNLIYQSKTYDALKDQPGFISQTLAITLGNNTWTMKAYVNKNIATLAQRNQPGLILASGVALSFMLSGILLILMISRARAISDEKNQEVQEAKDSLISLASHQLRTPATGVKQFIGMVLEGYAGDINSEQRDMLSKAYDSNERQLEIINQILHVTRADSGRLVINKVKLDIVKLIGTVIEEHKHPISERQQKVIFKQPKAIFVKADHQYIAMAVDNLLSNASKYSYPKSTIRIRVQDLDDHITITVSDKGVGIAEEDMPHLFQKFSRIDNELSIEAGGNGIGLYLCQEIVDMHNGEIEVTSSPDHGATFTVTLPKR